MGTAAPIDLTPVPPGQVTLSDRRTERSWTVDLAP
ncbi:formylglycine-generating enzyme family protein, partial [Streptomyces sp. MBT65]|nr:formylglycine-generating enzyme family protein [Streptomyces sp. MBT65]